MAWAQGENGHPVCWLYGPAGSGKSTVVHTLAQRYDEDKRLAFSFFFSRRNLDRSDATKFILTFAYQLAVALPLVTQAIQDALFRDPSILRQRLKDQFTKLIINPLQSIKHYIHPMVVVVDGLDECCDEGHVNEIIELLVPALPQFPFRLLFTS
jgi:ATP/maltotriose-dependent transcriptional regulator MalT